MGKINLPVLFSQKDSRWGTSFLGFNTKIPFNMANYGCYVTAWAMVCRYYGKDVDPKTLNDKLKTLSVGKGFANGGDYVPGGVNLLFGDIKENRVVTPTLLTDAQFSDIRTAIDNGYPVIIGIDVSPKTVEYNSHFVVVVGYNTSEENDLTIADPIGGLERSLKYYLGWFKPDAKKTIESYVITSGPKPKVTADTIIVSKDHYDLYMRNHDKWHMMVHYLKPDSDPNSAVFEDLRTIVAGIKSRQTDLENQLSVIGGRLAISETEGLNNADQISRLQEQLLKAHKSKKAEIDALIATMPDVSKIRGQYEGTILDLQGQVDQAKKAEGQAKINLAKCEGETIEVKGAIQKIVDWILSFVHRG